MMRNNKDKSLKAGFTLIELLVVISIIGILATLLLANVAGVRERARDAQRKSDINQIQKALELYKNSQSTPSYPASLDLLVPTFVKVRPRDPKYNPTCTENCWDYSYANPNPDTPTDSLTYKLIACLENASDPQKDSSLASYCSGKPASFTRTEP